MSRKILGLDIKEKSLAAVLINGTLQGNQIEVFEYIEFSEIDEETDKEGGLTDTPGEVLEKMLGVLSERIDIAGCTCIASLPAPHLSYRNVFVPFKNEKKIKQVILFELEPVMPGSVDDLVVDFKILDSEGEDEQAELVAAIVERAVLESFELCLKTNGFEAQAVAPGGCAAAEYLTKGGDNSQSDYLFADIDKETCTLFVIKSNQIVFIRSFAINANNLVALGANINRTVLSFCEQNDVEYNPELLYATGLLFNEPEIIEELGAAANLKVELTDFRKSTELILENKYKPLWNPAVFDNALIIAYNVMSGVSGFRFSERFFDFGKYYSEHKKQIINTGILLLLVVIIGLSNTIFNSYTVNKKINELNKQMVSVFREAFPEKTNVRNPYSQMKGLMDEARKKSAFQDKSSGDIRIIDMLNEISKKLPAEFDVEFERFVLGTENLKITGIADTYKTVDSMKKEMEKISFFSKVVISSTTNDKSGAKVKFKFKIEF